MMKPKNFFLIFMLIAAPTFNVLFIAAETNYPVLVWDEQPPLFVGKEFSVTFTCFSDNNKTINVKIIIDEIDIEWEGNEIFYVNRKVTLKTNNQLPGPGHTLKIIATDFYGKVKELSSFLTIDTIDPFFTKLEVGPLTIDSKTSVNFNWSVFEENFKELLVCRNTINNVEFRTSEKYGSFDLPFYFSVSTNFTLLFVAADTAGNSVNESYSINYLVNPGDNIPIEEHEQIIQELIAKWRGSIVGFIFGMVIIFIAVIFATVLVGKLKKDFYQKLISGGHKDADA